MEPQVKRRRVDGEKEGDGRSFDDAVKGLFSSQHRGAALDRAAGFRKRTVPHVRVSEGEG